MLTRWAVITLWRALALVCVALGLVGAFLPVLPTTPFLLVAAWAGSKGWPQLEAWLLAHPRWGPGLRRWRDHGAVPRRAKWAAIVMMAASAAFMAISPAPPALTLGVAAVMFCVAWWLWKRPET